MAETVFQAVGQTSRRYTRSIRNEKNETIFVRTAINYLSRCMWVHSVALNMSE